MVQWLRLHALNARGSGLNSGQRNRYYMQLKILHATTRMCFRVATAPKLLCLLTLYEIWSCFSLLYILWVNDESYPLLNTTCIIETLVWFFNPLRASNFQWAVHVWLILTFVVQSLSCVWLFMTPWSAAWQPSLSFTISWSLLRFMSIELVIVCGL